jgi:hypothetical protein
MGDPAVYTSFKRPRLDTEAIYYNPPHVNPGVCSHYVRQTRPTRSPSPYLPPLQQTYSVPIRSLSTPQADSLCVYGCRYQLQPTVPTERYTVSPDPYKKLPRLDSFWPAQSQDAEVLVSPVSYAQSASSQLSSMVTPSTQSSPQEQDEGSSSRSRKRAAPEKKPLKRSKTPSTPVSDSSSRPGLGIHSIPTLVTYDGTPLCTLIKGYQNMAKGVLEHDPDSMGTILGTNPDMIYVDLFFRNREATDDLGVCNWASEVSEKQIHLSQYKDRS